MIGSIGSIISSRQQSLPELSFEFFSPQGGVGVDRLLSGTVAKLNAFHPVYCSVTRGAGGSTHSGTQTQVERLLGLEVNAVPHLSVGGSSDAELDQPIDHYQHIGMRQILCLRDDQPYGSGQRPVYEKHLVERLRSRYQDHFKLSVAAYAELHPDVASADADIQHFVAKVRARASSAITQYFHYCDAYPFFLDRCAAAGLTVPVNAHY